VKWTAIAEAAIIRETRAADLGLCPACLQQCDGDYYSLLIPGDEGRWIFCTRCLDQDLYVSLVANLTIVR
jgi:hypothetical protein